MRILALDLGARTGFAWGDHAEHPPWLGVVRLQGDTIRHKAGFLHQWLWQFLADHVPDIIAVENFLPPSASFSQDATVGQLMMHGVLHGVAGHLGHRVVSVNIATCRKHFVGQAAATRPPRAEGKRTSAQKSAARIAIKNMVISRARQLGYLRRGEEKSFEDLSALADAACVYDWAVAHIAMAGGARFELFAATH